MDDPFAFEKLLPLSELPELPLGSHAEAQPSDGEAETRVRNEAAPPADARQSRS
ncbi:hypothetical protein [Nocardiopsis baichengensis]|uniref:hypothetical protein n=1 Tax=Nocardiopsis baichengensis TaxID=280240 RepID=UPI0013786053|nr:hypothetical protein [Nocardiopsis baichengensis]